jgi:transcription-repair coupling factor
MFNDNVWTISRLTGALTAGQSDLAIAEFLPDTALAWLANEIRLSANGWPVALIVDHDWQTRKLAAILRAYLPNETEKIIIWPGDSPAPLELSSSPTSALAIIYYDNLLKNVVTPACLEKLSLKIKNSLFIKPEEVVTWLVENGLLPAKTCDQAGVFAHRGDILDFCLNENQGIIRFSWNVNQIEKIEINQPHKKSWQTITEIKLNPKKLFNDQQTTSAWELLKNNWINIGPKRLLPEEDNHYDETYIEDKPKIWLSINDPEQTGAHLDIKTLAPLIYQRISPQEFAKKYNNYKFFAVGQRANDINQALGEQIQAQQLVLAPNLSVGPGFVCPSNKIIWLTDQTIFGPQKNQSPVASNLSSLIQLSVDDYVVHVDHGVGQFKGLVQQAVNNVEREYLLIIYAGDDKLFVPTEQIGKVEKYIGPVRPKLQKLDKSTNWPGLIKKAKAETIKDAQELLDLYARRHLSQSVPLLKTATEDQMAADFPFELTPDQTSAWQAAQEDLAGDVPADRLICGDVGFGKTEVAIRAAFRAASNGVQTVVLCPTTVLAQQHEDTFKKRLEKYNFKIAGAFRFKDRQEIKEILTAARLGTIDILIGTHRLLSPDVKFKKLGLIIIDEEQRFGVRHKEALKKIRTGAHVLTLSATPIPRTLHLAMSGLRDLSVINTAPHGRLPVETNIVEYDVPLIKQALEKEIARGGQAYYLYNKVETIDLKAKELQTLLPKARLAVAHGQINPEKLAEIMHRFDYGEIDILVCSTIVENGLDVPNVNTLIVDDAPRFGLSQLYQLRGRIGRGQVQAFAFFMFNRQKLTGLAGERLKMLQQWNQPGGGFSVAMRDLELRGVGSILGKKQHGHVTAIGLTHYEKLLKETVDTLLHGTPPTLIADTVIDLDLPLALAKKIMPSETDRVRVYQKLATCASVEEIEKITKDLIHQNGHSEEFTRLGKLFAIKLTAGMARLPRIYRSVDNLITIYLPTNANHKAIVKTVAYQPHWLFSGDKLTAKTANLGQDWLDKIINACLLLGESVE